MHEIVVGVDRSAAARRALDRALVEAQVSGCPLEVLNTWAPPVWTGGASEMGYDLLVPVTDSQSVTTELVDDLLAKALTRCESDAPVSVRAVAVNGDPGRELVDASREGPLVVLGGRGLGYFASALLGSTTDYVLHHAQCPVMVVPETGPPAARFDRVVVGLDGSASAQSALRWGLDAAKRHGCPLVAVHAVSFPMLPGNRPLYSTEVQAAYETQAVLDLEQEVAAVTSEHQDVQVSVQVVYQAPAAGLLDTAGPDDLLVLGSRGRGGFASLVLGSVATQCAQHGRGVVVVVRVPRGELDPSVDVMLSPVAAAPP